VSFCSATFFCARKNAARFSSSGAKKRRLPPERYAKYQIELFVNILIVDKYVLIIYNKHYE